MRSFTTDKENSLAEGYPIVLDETQELLTISSNATIVDKDGIIIAWILPQLLSADRQVHQMMVL